MTDPFALMAAGAGLVLVLFVAVVGAVVLVVHYHEVRELRAAAQYHAEIKDEIADMKRLTLLAINGRAAIQADMDSLKVKVKDLDQRVIALEGL